MLPGPLIAVAATLLVAGIAILTLPGVLLGLVIIREHQVGIVVKKFSFSGKSLSSDSLVALNGEAGFQADTLSPGWHFGYWSWMYSIHKINVTIIPQGEIGLVVAAAGASIPTERILARTIDCDNFQDVRKFLNNSGEKGRQIAILKKMAHRGGFIGSRKIGGNAFNFDPLAYFKTG